MEESLSVQTDIDGRLILGVEVQPNSARSAVTGFNHWRGTLQCSVKAQAQRGAANRELREVIATALGLPNSAVEIISGQTARRKRIRIKGMAVDALKRSLSSILDTVEG